MGTVPTARVFADKPDPTSILIYADWNAALYSVTTFLLNPPMVHVKQSVAQNITNASFAAINFDTEVIDTEGSHSSTNSSRITPKTPGWYIGYFGGSWASNTTGYRTYIPVKNGALSTATYGRTSIRPTTGGTAQIGYRFFMFFNGTTDYVELWAWQNSTLTLGTFVVAEEVYPQMALRWWKAS